MTVCKVEDIVIVTTTGKNQLDGYTRMVIVGLQDTLEIIVGCRIGSHIGMEGYLSLPLVGSCFWQCHLETCIQCFYRWVCNLTPCRCIEEAIGICSGLLMFRLYKYMVSKMRNAGSRDWISTQYTRSGYLVSDVHLLLMVLYGTFAAIPVIAFFVLQQH